VKRKLYCCSASQLNLYCDTSYYHNYKLY